MLGARMRERRTDLYGPSARRSAREVENERLERGHRTLNDVYCGVPSRADFLARADLKCFTEKSSAVPRAFIVPGGLASLEQQYQQVVQAFWYRSTGATGLLVKGDVILAMSGEGQAYRVRMLENMTGARYSHKGSTRERMCTGVVLCAIERAPIA
jgi:hypothetical protein